MRETEEVRLKDMTCPQCKKEFVLRWDDLYTPYLPASQKKSLIIRACPSGGIYDVFIECPHCYYEEEL